MLPARVPASEAILPCAAHAALARDVAAIAPAGAWSSISTPIARAALVAALDLDPTLSRALTLVQAVRRLHEDDTRRGTLRARRAAALLSAQRQAAAPARKVPAQEASAPQRPTVGGSVEGDDDLVAPPPTQEFWGSCGTKAPKGDRR